MRTLLLVLIAVITFAAIIANVDDPLVVIIAGVLGCAALLLARGMR